MILLWSKKDLRIYVRTWMYSFTRSFFKGSFSLILVEMHHVAFILTHVRMVGYNHLIRFVTFIYFFQFKKRNFIMVVHMVPNLWWDLILNSKYIHIIRLRYLLNASHTYEFIYHLYIFQTLINADQFYREVNERYGIVQHSTVRYMVIVILSKGYNFSNSNLLLI